MVDCGTSIINGQQETIGAMKFTSLPLALLFGVAAADLVANDAVRNNQNARLRTRDEINLERHLSSGGWDWSNVLCKS